MGLDGLSYRFLQSVNNVEDVGASQSDRWMMYDQMSKADEIDY
jgi:hypothetical protein